MALSTRLEGGSFDARQAVALQQQLAEHVRRESTLGPIRYIAGVDCSAPRFPPTIRAAIVLLNYPTMEVLETAFHEETATVPYMPGLLSFRELPAILGAWERLTIVPDLIFVDGQGIAHPRRLGIAAHLGVLLDLPTIGVAKSILVGRPMNQPLADEAGSRLDLFDEGERIAVLLRTKRRTKPLVISTGHRIGIDDAVTWVLRCTQGYRLPEPTRRAHLAAGRAVPS